MVSVGMEWRHCFASAVYGQKALFSMTQLLAQPIEYIFKVSLSFRVLTKEENF